MIYRRGVALLALAGLFLSTYLYLYKLGFIGTLACGSGGCETVQLSPQSRFLGLEVASIGVGGYAVLLLLALLALHSRFSGASWPVEWLAGLSGIAVLFTVYLTYLELYVIHAICRFCVGSAAIIAGLFTLTLLELRRTRTRPA